ncbi:MAG: hypothetical protein ACT6TH_14625 [Brevundimonas sp.]|uniref:hypothetical protein n=1 Tax=Brevundimonas sp. TaxID=1871086 RepID=UPI0040349F1B
MNRDDAFAADLPRLDQELQDRQTVEQLTAIAAELITKGSEARAGVTALLREIHERDPGVLPRMRDGLQLARLQRMGPSTAH